MKENNIKNDSIIFNYIEKDLSGNPMRVFINIKENIPSLEKPNLIRKLESFLKKNLDPGLQVYYQEKKI